MRNKDKKMMLLLDLFNLLWFLPVQRNSAFLINSFQSDVPCYMTKCLPYLT